MEGKIKQSKVFRAIDIIAVIFITFFANVVVAAAVALGYSFIYALGGGDLTDASSLMEAIYLDPSVLMFSATYNLLAIGIVFLFWRFLDRQNTARLGFAISRSTGRQILWGILMAVAAVAAIIALGTAFGIINYKSSGASFFSTSEIAVAMLMGIVTFILVGFGEEAVYRSYVQNHLVDMIGKRYGLLIAALIFTFVHLLTYGKALDLIDVFFAGIIMGYGFILTKSIYLPAAFHFMWDYLQLSVFRLQHYEYYNGPVLYIFDNTGDLIINNYNWGNKLEVIFIIVELMLLFIMYIFRNKISKLASN